MERYYLGIDTSCYTTSCAIVDSSGHIVGEARKLLSVKPGERGLKQSQMVFQHTRALPELMESLPIYTLSGIGVSAFPRRALDSYMPAFLVGLGQGRTLAHILQIPLYQFSHQENHILAALRPLGDVIRQPFFSLHLSGGTTDLLYCTYDNNGFFRIEKIGTSIDLQGGQFVDRVGVALGLGFPAGRELERLALTAKDYDPLPSSVKEGEISFGGPCSEALRRIERGVVPGSMALSVFKAIERGLTKMIAYHLDRYNVNTLVAVGGVMSNSLLRKGISDFCRRHGTHVIYAEPQYSVDNATGVAFGVAYLNQ